MHENINKEHEQCTKHSAMARFICFAWGHKIAEETESGYEYCERCNAHSYYDYPHFYSRSAYLRQPFWFVKKKLHRLIEDVKFCIYKLKGGKLPF